MRQILTIGFATFGEAIRRKILVVFLLFAIISIVCSQVFKTFSPGEEDKFVIDMGLNAIRWFSVLIAILLGAVMIPQEIERKTLHTILAKPVGRGQFILGKFAGTCMAVLFNAGLMSIAFLIVYIVQRHGRPLDASLLIQLVLTYCELVLFVSIVIFLSSFSSTIFVLVVSFCVIVIGSTASFWSTIPPDNLASQMLFMSIHALAPNFEIFDVSRAILTNSGISLDLIYYPIVYGGMYSTIMLLLGFVIFNERQF
jgi:ABC-type transport system involved in multi-copper enzyme maturation permease subunit